MGCFGPIAAPLIYRVKLPSHCTVCYTVLFLSYNPLKYIDFLTATNSSKGVGRTFESCWAGQLLNSSMDTAGD